MTGKTFDVERRLKFAKKMISFVAKVASTEHTLSFRIHHILFLLDKMSLILPALEIYFTICHK